MNYTLNQLNQKINLFAIDHGQIKGNYSFGELEEVTNQGINKFPYLFGILKPSMLGGQSAVITISIVIMDLVHKDLSNRVEVWSDVLQIFTDFRAYMTDPDFSDYFILDNSENIVITPFADRFTDDVTGWVGDFKFRIVDTLDRCSIPDA